MNRKLSVLLLAIVSASCISISSGSKTKAVLTAEKAVESFHLQLNSEEYPRIFAQSHQEFKDAIGESKAIEYFAAVGRKLGKVKSAELKNWETNNANNRTLVALFYETQFDEDKAREEFIWLINGDQAILFRYNVDSPTLVSK